MPKETYRIGEAAKLLGLETYVLRFWETEFPQLAPMRTPKGQRVYTEETMAVLFKVKELLHERGMTIDGARRILAGDEQPPAAAGTSIVRGIRDELVALRDQLRSINKDTI